MTATEQIRFDDKVVIVTGAGRGLGRAHALLLARLGATVVVNDLGSEVGGGGQSPEPASEVVGEIEAAGGKAVADFSDVASCQAMERLVASTVERFGKLDAVIANAGVSQRLPFDEMDPDSFDRMVKIQLYGTFNIMRCAWPHLIEAGRGRAVVTTGNSLFGGPNAHYSAAKAGIVGLMRSLALQGRPHGVGINAVAPGGYTRMVSTRATAGTSAVPNEWMAKFTAPEKVSPTYAWLAHESCEVTGEIFSATGGVTKRVLLGQTQGWGSPDVTPEDLRDHWDEVMDEKGYTLPPDFSADAKDWKITLEALAGQTADV
jgi:NAD(P)-dependent dehydrogenase (short-subunit alcohol dehydrogenase family)